MNLSATVCATQGALAVVAVGWVVVPGAAWVESVTPVDVPEPGWGNHGEALLEIGVALLPKSRTTRSPAKFVVTTPTAPAVTTNFAGDRVVRLFGSRATPISSSASPWFPQPGSGTSTGVTDSTQAAPGTTTQPTATTASAPWVAHTVALKFIGTCSPCYYGVEDGSNTYYRDAINAAQAELVANGRPNATHAIIFLGDGGVNTTVPGDALPCHSPITASQNAQNPTPPLVGTWVYSIAYNARSEEHTSELQSRENLVCRLLLEKKKKKGETLFVELKKIVNVDYSF